MIEKKPTAGPANPGAGGVLLADSHNSATSRKWQRVLRWLVEGGTLNRFDAAREVRDWCLNTTISQLEQRGVRILRREETVPGAFGPVRCLRYSVAPEALERARELLGERQTAQTV